MWARTAQEACRLIPIFRLARATALWTRGRVPPLDRGGARSRSQRGSPGRHRWSTAAAPCGNRASSGTPAPPRPPDEAATARHADHGDIRRRRRPRRPFPYPSIPPRGRPRRSGKGPIDRWTRSENRMSFTCCPLPSAPARCSWFSRYERCEERVLDRGHPFFPRFLALAAELAQRRPVFDLGTSGRFAKEMGLVRHLV